LPVTLVHGIHTVDRLKMGLACQPAEIICGLAGDVYHFNLKFKTRRFIRPDKHSTQKRKKKNKKREQEEQEGRTGAEVFNTKKRNRKPKTKHMRQESGSEELPSKEKEARASASKRERPKDWNCQKIEWLYSGGTVKSETKR